MEINGTKRDLENCQPTRYELIDKDGKVVVQDTDMRQLIFLAESMWPDQEQDEERSGKGWDIAVVGADR